MRYNAPPRYELLKRYAEDVDAGWLSPLIKFNGYEALYNRIQTEIVGQTAANGVVITGQSRHFMQRVVGTMIDPKKLKDDLIIVRRSGVEIEDLKDTIFKSVDIRKIKKDRFGRRSQKIVGSTCVVAINPDRGELIQTNPIGG